MGVMFHMFLHSFRPGSNKVVWMSAGIPGTRVDRPLGLKQRIGENMLGSCLRAGI